MQKKEKYFGHITHIPPIIYPNFKYSVLYQKFTLALKQQKFSSALIHQNNL